MHEKRVKTNQIELQIQDNEHKGEAIIFLHFSGANLMMWQRAIPYFQDQYRLILVDLRGHGKSQQAESGYHMDEMARDIVGMMAHLGIDRAHIVGSSLGAEVGLSMAANYPDKVISLVCDGALNSEYGPYGTWEGSEDDFEAHVAEQLEKIRSTPEAFFPSAEAFVASRQALFEQYDWWNEYLAATEQHGVYQTEGGQYRKAFGRQATAVYMANYYHYRFEDYYAKVTCPLLMLAEKDSEDEREKAAMQGLKELAAQGEIAEIDEWAHPYMWFLNPEGACQAILKFLGSITA